MYTGEADWTLIGEVKKNPRIHIPVIGNGDVTTPQRAKECFDLYGVDAIMIGRASFGRPWIFKEVKHYIETGEELPTSVFRLENGCPPPGSVGQRQSAGRTPRYIACTPPSGCISHI